MKRGFSSVLLLFKAFGTIAKCAVGVLELWRDGQSFGIGRMQRQIGRNDAVGKIHKALLKVVILLEPTLQLSNRERLGKTNETMAMESSLVLALVDQVEINT